MDETKNPSETEGSQPPVEGSGGSPDETKRPVRNRRLATPVEGSGGSSDGDPSRIGRYTDHPTSGSGRRSDGSISPTTMTSTAPWPSRCRTLNESPIPRMWRRFSNEARILAKLDHPNIVPVYRCGSHGRRTLLRGLEAHRRQRSGGQD